MWNRFILPKLGSQFTIKNNKIIIFTPYPMPCAVIARRDWNKRTNANKRPRAGLPNALCCYSREDIGINEHRQTTNANKRPRVGLPNALCCYSREDIGINEQRQTTNANKRPRVGLPNALCCYSREDIGINEQRQTKDRKAITSINP